MQLNDYLQKNAKHFYIVAQERGTQYAALPIWANLPADVLNFEDCPRPPVERINISEVPGTFQLLHVLTDRECERIIQITEAMGYSEDAPVTLPRSIRHNCNVTWVVDESIDGAIWDRCKDLIDEQINGEVALGVNAKFRFYRYGAGEYFKPHSDGAWPGSRVINGRLHHDAYEDRWSQMSFLLFLSDGYTGGRTQFFVSQEHPAQPAHNEEDRQVISVRTPKGAVLCFPHGNHPLHCIHASENISSGVKYIIRTDVLFGKEDKAADV